MATANTVTESSMTAPSDRPGPVAALDLGEKRIGVALSDSTRTIASPHSVVRRASRAEDFGRFAALIETHRVSLIVIGLPITLDGQEGQRAAWVRDYAGDLGLHIDIPIEFWDESLTTVAATDALHTQGRRGRKLRDRVDAVAAALILQSYLDAHRGDSPHDE